MANKSERKVNHNARGDIQNSLGELRKIVTDLEDREDLDDNDTLLLLRSINRIFKIYEYKSRGYGPSWKVDGLDARVLFGDSVRKVQRLVTMFWRKLPEQWETHKIVECLYDMTLYNLLTVARLVIEHGVNFDLVYDEVHEQRTEISKRDKKLDPTP